jgi:hypothetical protein
MQYKMFSAVWLLPHTHSPWFSFYYDVADDIHHGFQKEVSYTMKEKVLSVIIKQMK